MAIMAGMLPGVERARRRRLRLRQGRSSSSAGAAAQAPCGTRRAPSSSCRLLGGPSSSAPKQGRSGACVETLDGSAREAKERLDQKLRGTRESSVVVRNKKHQSTGAARPPTTAEAHGAASSSSLLQQHPSAAGATPTPCPCAVRREVLSEPEEQDAGRRRWLSCCWTRLRRRLAAQAEACDEECAVCLEELRAGDVVARLPCAHRFHWSCAAPWVRAASRCPVCRARARLDLPRPADRDRHLHGTTPRATTGVAGAAACQSQR